MDANCSNIALDRPMGESVSFIVLYIFLGIFICSANILTIIAVWRTPILRTVPNMYVVSLAVADLMVGGMAVPSQLTFLIPSLRQLQDLDKHFCLFGHVTYLISVMTSINSMGVISLDRAFYIGYPLQYNRLVTTKTAQVIIACAWIVSLVVGTVPAYYNNWNSCGNCYIFNVKPAMYQISVQIGMVVVVCIITASSYGFIFRIARSKHVLNRQQASSRFQADMKLVKTFMMVFGLFVVCWIPLLIIVILGHLTGIYVRSIFLCALFLSSLNSGMNFFVYTVTNSCFRRAIAKLICRNKQNNEVVAFT